LCAKTAVRMGGVRYMGGFVALWGRLGFDLCMRAYLRKKTCMGPMCCGYRIMLPRSQEKLAPGKMACRANLGGQDGLFGREKVLPLWYCDELKDLCWADVCLGGDNKQIRCRRGEMDK